MSQEKPLVFYNSLNSNSQRILSTNTLSSQPLYPKFFQEQQAFSLAKTTTNTSIRPRHQIFSKENTKVSQRDRSLDPNLLLTSKQIREDSTDHKENLWGNMSIKTENNEFCGAKDYKKDKSLEYIPFENSFSNAGLKEALAKEIKENIDMVKGDLMDSFRNLLETFKKESREMDEKLEFLKNEENSSEKILKGFDENFIGIQDKLQDITNKLPSLPAKNHKNFEEKQVFEEIMAKKTEEMLGFHKQIRQDLQNHKENLQNSSLPTQNQEKLSQAKQIIEKSTKSLQQMNKGFQYKANLVKDQLSRKFHITQHKLIQDMDSLEKSWNYEQELQGFFEMSQKLEEKFIELKALSDQMSQCLSQKLNKEDFERFFEKGPALQEALSPVFQEFREFSRLLQGETTKFMQFKEEIHEILQGSQQKIAEILAKKEGVVERKVKNFEKAYSKLGDLQGEIDKLEGLLQGLNGFCEKFLDFQKELQSQDSKKLDMKEEIIEKQQKIDDLYGILEEVKDTQEHFSSKLELISQKFKYLQEKTFDSQAHFFKEIESFHENPMKTPCKPAISNPFELNEGLLSPEAERLKGVQITRSPVTSLNVNILETLKSPIKSPLEAQSMKSPLKVQEKSKTPNKNPIKLKSPLLKSPLHFENDAFLNSKSPLNKGNEAVNGKELRGMTNQCKLVGLGGDNDMIAGRWSSIGKSKGSYERLSEMGFKNCEETGFQVNEEGFVLGIDGQILMDSEAKPIKLLPEYIEFLSHN